MQLTITFAVLLATIVALYSSPLEVEAAPTALVRAPTGRVTMPLRRVERRSDGVHPQVLLQQHINRAHRRYARMSGRAEPERASMKRAVQKRVASLEELGLAKRGMRMGLAGASMNAAEPVSNKASTSQAVSLGDIISAITGSPSAGTIKGSSDGQNKNKQGKGNGAAAAAGAAGAGTAAGVGAAAAANGTDLGGQPFPKAVFQAAQADTLSKADTPTANDSIGLDDEANDVSYVATVQLGTPPQDFSVIMDTGSADFWVGAENCVGATGGNCGKHTFLGAQGSSSFQDSKKAFQVTYGSGAVAGTIVQDNLVMAGLSLKAHTFGTAQQESQQFTDDVNADGLMGLAQGTLSEQQVPTPPEALASAGLISDAIVSVKLARLADGKNDGEITFGALDDTKLDAASLVTVDNVNKQGFWEAAMDAVTVDGQDAGLSGRTAILDTGTTLIIAPDADAAALMAMIPGAKSDGQGGFTVPCTTNASVALSFGGTSFAIDARDLAFLPVSNDLSGDCTAGVASGQIGGAKEWLVGDVFLKNVYASFDTGKDQISLANLAGAGAASAGSGAGNTTSSGAGAGTTAGSGAGTAAGSGAGTAAGSGAGATTGEGAGSATAGAGSQSTGSSTKGAGAKGADN